MTEADVREAIENPIKFKALFEGHIEKIKYAGYLYPNLKSSLLNVVINLHWDDLIKNANDLLSAITAFPWEIEIVEKLFSIDDKKFNTIFETMAQFKQCLINFRLPKNKTEKLVLRAFTETEATVKVIDYLGKSTLNSLVNMIQDHCQSEIIIERIYEIVINILLTLSEDKLFYALSLGIKYEMSYLTKTIFSIKNNCVNQIIDKILEIGKVRSELWINYGNYFRLAENRSTEQRAKIFSKIKLSPIELINLICNNKDPNNTDVNLNDEEIEIFLRQANSYPNEAIKESSQELFIFKDSFVNVTNKMSDVRMNQLLSSPLLSSIILNNIRVLTSLTHYHPYMSERLSEKINGTILIAEWMKIKDKVSREDIRLFRIQYPEVNLFSTCNAQLFSELMNDKEKFKFFLDVCPDPEKEEILNFVLHNKKVNEFLKNEYDVEILISTFPDQENIIRSWLSQPEQQERFGHFSALVVSVQKPYQTEISGPQNGKSGMMLSKLTGGGYIYVHRDKQLSEDDKQIVSQHLHSNSWLIVTGHGNSEGEEITGGYFYGKTDKMVDINLSPQELVNLLLSSNQIKSGDHLNVVLYSCYAADACYEHAVNGDFMVGDSISRSYAQNLANEFSKKGISTRIIASTELVQRIGGYGVLKDTPGEFIKFRTEKLGLFYFSQEVGKECYVYKIPTAVYFGKDKIHFKTEKAKQSAISYFLNCLKKEFSKIDISPRILEFDDFETITTQKAGDEVRNNNNLVIIRKSSQAGYFTLTYFNNGIKHHRIPLPKFDDNGMIDPVAAHNIRRTIQAALCYSLSKSQGQSPTFFYSAQSSQTEEASTRLTTSSNTL